MPRLKNIREEKFCHELVKNNGNATRAYLKAYKSSLKTADCTATHVMRREHVQDRIYELLEAQGLNDDLAARKLKGLLDAKKQIVLKDELHAVEDNGTQIDALKTYLKIKGYYDQSKDNQGAKSYHIHIENKQDLEELKNITTTLNQLNNQLNQGLIQDGEIV